MTGNEFYDIMIMFQTYLFCYANGRETLPRMRGYLYFYLTEKKFHVIIMMSVYLVYVLCCNNRDNLWPRLSRLLFDKIFMM